MSRIALSVVAALLLGAAVPALAQQTSSTQPASRVVAYGDLNLDSAAGADAMLGRIDDAARHVCGDRAGPRPVREVGVVHSCVGETSDNAVAELGNANVSAHYRGYTPEVVVGDDDTYAYPEKGKTH